MRLGIKRFMLYLLFVSSLLVSACDNEPEREGAPIYFEALLSPFELSCVFEPDVAIDPDPSQADQFHGELLSIQDASSLADFMSTCEPPGLDGLTVDFTSQKVFVFPLRWCGCDTYESVKLLAYDEGTYYLPEFSFSRPNAVCTAACDGLGYLFVVSDQIQISAFTLMRYEAKE